MRRSAQHIAIDVGISQIKIAFLESSGADAIIKKLIVEDVRKVPRDKLDIKIKELLEKSFSKQELSDSTVSFILSYPFVEIKRLELPHMPMDEIREAIIWQAKDKIALNIDECFFDFVVVKEKIEEYGSKKLIVMVAISPKSVINKFANISKELDLEIVGINVCPFSFSGILNKYKIDKDIVSVVEIGYEHTYISLYKENKLVFLRVVPVASNQLTSAMAGVYTTDSAIRIELSEDEAELLKRKYGIPLDITSELLENKVPTKQLLARMRPILESLSTEIKRSFDYYITELAGEEPKKIYLAGGGAQIKNLNVFLKDDLKIDTENLKLPQDVKNQTNLDILPVLGAVSALMDALGQRPDLLPVEFRRRKLQRVEKISIRMVAFTAFSILFLSYIILSLRVNDYKNRLISAKSHRAVIQDLVDVHSRVSQREKLRSKISSGSLSYIDIFKEMSIVIPNDVMLDRIYIDEDDKVMNIRGKLFYQVKMAEDVLASFMQDIENSPLFKEANLRKVERREKKSAKISNFEIECKIE